MGGAEGDEAFDLGVLVVGAGGVHADRVLLAADDIPYALAFSVGGMLLASALQTWSHAFEPVPPPLSGQREFLAFGVWWSQGSPGRKLAAVALETAFIALELLASFRILPCRLRVYTLALGHAPADRIALDRKVAALRAAWPY